MHISISRLLQERWPFDTAFSPAELATQQGGHLPPEIFHISFFHSVLLPPSPLALFSIRASFQAKLQWQNGFFHCFPFGAQPCLFPSYLIDHIFLGHHFLHFTVYYLFMFMCMQCSVRNSQMIVVSQETIYLPHDLHPNDFNSIQDKHRLRTQQSFEKWQC